MFGIRFSHFAAFLLAGVLLASKVPACQGQTADSDAKKVMALLRLKHIDVQERPSLKEVVVRHMQRVEEESEWLTLAERFVLPENESRLIQMVQDSSQQAHAARALVQLKALGKLKSIFRVVEATLAPLDPDGEPEPQPPAELVGDELPSDIRQAATSAERLGLLQEKDVADWLAEQLQLAERYPLPVARALVGSMIKMPEGAERLLAMAEQQQIPGAIRLAVGSALARSNDPQLVERAGKVLPLPEVANKTLPPMDELVAMKGNMANGQKMFAGVGTCAKCHVVNGAGSAVGPDLSEIGSKLARDAMYTAILDPSAAISHNYENYAIQTLDGKLVTGLLMSETEEKVTLKSSEGVPIEVLREDIDEMQKLKMSLMPADLARPMSVQDLVDLVEYMTSLKKAE